MKLFSTQEASPFHEAGRREGRGEGSDDDFRILRHLETRRQRKRLPDRTRLLRRGLRRRLRRRRWRRRWWEWIPTAQQRGRLREQQWLLITRLVQAFALLIGLHIFSRLDLLCHPSIHPLIADCYKSPFHKTLLQVDWSVNIVVMMLSLTCWCDTIVTHSMFHQPSSSSTSRLDIMLTCLLPLVVIQVVQYFYCFTFQKFFEASTCWLHIFRSTLLRNPSEWDFWIGFELSLDFPQSAFWFGVI